MKILNLIGWLKTVFGWMVIMKIILIIFTGV